MLKCRVRRCLNVVYVNAFLEGGGHISSFGGVGGGDFTSPSIFNIKIPNEFYTMISVVSLQFVFTLKSLMNFIQGFQLFHNRNLILPYISQRLGWKINIFEFLTAFFCLFSFYIAKKEFCIGILKGILFGVFKMIFVEWL